MMSRDQIESLHRGLVTKVDKQLVDLQKQKELQKKREEEEKLRKIREQMELERKKREEEERRRKQLEEDARMYVLIYFFNLSFWFMNFCSTVRFKTFKRKSSIDPENICEIF